MNPMELWRSVTLWDLVDVLVVAFLIYNLLLLIRGTRAVHMLVGIGLLLGLFGFAQVGDLPTLKLLLGNLPILLPVAVIVLFQPEIRRALANFGRNRLWSIAKQSQVASIFDEIVVAANTLSSRRTGALIVLEREEGLRPYIENGIKLDSAFSFDLLVTIFHPETPLHDGAVIVQEDRIAAAACFLPLSPNPEVSKELGTRHRAALGITEETDALAVVISEETGQISVAVEGRLIRNLDTNDLRNQLHLHLISSLYGHPGTRLLST